MLKALLIFLIVNQAFAETPSVESLMELNMKREVVESDINCWGTVNYLLGWSSELTFSNNDEFALNLAKYCKYNPVPKPMDVFRVYSPVDGDNHAGVLLEDDMTFQKLAPYMPFKTYSLSEMTRDYTAKSYEVIGVCENLQSNSLCEVTDYRAEFYTCASDSSISSKAQKALDTYLKTHNLADFENAIVTLIEESLASKPEVLALLSYTRDMQINSTTLHQKIKDEVINTESEELQIRLLSIINFEKDDPFSQEVMRTLFGLKNHRVLLAAAITSITENSLDRKKSIISYALNSKEMDILPMIEILYFQTCDSEKNLKDEKIALSQILSEFGFSDIASNCQ